MSSLNHEILDALKLNGFIYRFVSRLCHPLRFRPRLIPRGTVSHQFYFHSNLKSSFLSNLKKFRRQSARKLLD